MSTDERISGTPKLPPQALEAEQSLLGGLLLDNQRWDVIADEISTDDFYSKNHRLIFNAVCALQLQNEPADVITVSDWLGQSGQLEEVGGLVYVGELANQAPGTANLLNYARIVRERSILRSLITAANEIVRTAYTPDGRATRAVLDHAEKLVFDISERDGRRRQGFRTIQALVATAVDRMEELFESKETITGMPTGFVDLDEMTAGLQRGDLIVVAGRPSMGKTSFAMNVAEYVALNKKLPVMIFSMEMPGEQLAMRMLSSIGGLDSTKVRTGRLNDDEWPRVTNAVKLLQDAPIFIDDTAGLNPLDLSSRARRLYREQNNIGLIVIDYLQLMQSLEKESNENRATEISNITRGLKMLAKELDVPIVVLSQLNRSLETRSDKRPIMSDLRESGAIEQDADVIFFVYREEIYNSDSEHKGKAEIIIGKQRNGPIGTVDLTFQGKFTRFQNYLPEKVIASYNGD